MQDLIAKIAKGPRAAKDLTWDEAKQAMKALIEGEATPAQDRAPRPASATIAPRAAGTTPRRSSA
ncbi:MAG TPA: hypothetical protein VLL94_02740 [Nitrospiraceae bacterium]|nr:hypothetical protein [Nitrospiraceae bacterium]